MKTLQELISELAAERFPGLPAPKLNQPMLGHGDYYEIEFPAGVSVAEVDALLGEVDALIARAILGPEDLK